MDIGIAQKITTPAGDILLNQAISYAAGTGLFRLQDISGMDGAGIRNPTTDRPHKSGSIIHAFKRSASIYTLTGLFEAENVATRWAMRDHLLGYLDRIVDTDGTHTYTPPDGGADRYHTVRLYDPNENPIGPDGIAGPKQFTITLIAGDWRAYSAGDEILIGNGVPQFIPNLGNTEAWLNFTVEPAGADVNGLVLTRASDSKEIVWYGTELPTFGHSAALWNGTTADLNMLDETFYQGNDHNLLGGIDLTVSDFFSIPVGGDTITFTSDDGLADCVVAVKNAYVG